MYIYKIESKHQSLIGVHDEFLFLTKIYALNTSIWTQHIHLHRLTHTHTHSKWQSCVRWNGNQTVAALRKKLSEISFFEIKRKLGA